MASWKLGAVAVTAAAFLLGGQPQCLGAASPPPCSLNGDLDQTTGKCVCDPAWKGDECDLLNVQPLASDVAIGYKNKSGFDSWGGNAIFEDGKWHLFAAQFVEHCSLEHWGSNSEIIRAVSTNGPEGPFQYAETVVSAFAHNPTVRKTPDGTIVLYMIGHGGNDPSTIVNCTNSSSSSTTVHTNTNTNSNAARQTTTTNFSTDIFVTWADSVYGPWQPAPVPVVFNDTSHVRTTCGNLRCDWFGLVGGVHCVGTC